MSEVKYFEYGNNEIEYLKSRDPLLGSAIDRIGHYKRAVNQDLFLALINSILGQQISTKAHATVWARMQERYAPLDPLKISQISDEDLQKCGISFRKVEYIKEASDSILKGSLDLELLKTLPDDEVCKELTKIRGIGVWTAEMLMIFSMQRPDILSYDDLAIIRGMRMLYHHRKITPKLFAKYKRRYSPYSSVASLYLWAIAGGACPEMKDYAPKKSKKGK